MGKDPAIAVAEIGMSYEKLAAVEDHQSDSRLVAGYLIRYTPTLPKNSDQPVDACRLPTHILRHSRRSILSSMLCFSLELVLIVSGNDDIVDFQHHATQLRGQQQLLAFSNERIDDEMLSHVCLIVSI